MLHRIVDLHASVKFVSTLYVLQHVTILKPMVTSWVFLSNGTYSLHKEHFWNEVIRGSQILQHGYIEQKI